MKQTIKMINFKFGQSSFKVIFLEMPELLPAQLLFLYCSVLLVLFRSASV